MFDIYSTITDQICAMLDKGVVPWRSPILGRASAGHPKNLASGKQYRGVNTFLLAFTAYAKGYESSYWTTFKQAQEQGGTVRKGERSSMVVFWKQLETKDKTTGEDKRIPMLRYYNVFNVAQCEGLTAPDAVPFEPLAFTPIESCERIVSGYADGPALDHAGCTAFYRPSTDTVTMPEQTRFASCEEYYSTLFHELSHSTGHASRLNRLDSKNPQPFGSANYGKEELIAEMSAAFLCGRAGIDPSVIENQAAYLNGWLATIKGDKRLVLAAAGAAQKSADRILGHVWEEQATEPASV
jgi:antirestriction protein ArdC